MVRAGLTGVVGLAMLTVGCGGDEETGSTDETACEAWSTMMAAQPDGSFTDDESLGAAFSEFADAVADARPSFPGESGETLEDYEAALRAFAADPSGAAANEGMVDMLGRMTDVATRLAMVCGPDVVDID